MIVVQLLNWYVIYISIKKIIHVEQNNYVYLNYKIDILLKQLLFTYTISNIQTLLTLILLVVRVGRKVIIDDQLGYADRWSAINRMSRVLARFPTKAIF